MLKSRKGYYPLFFILFFLPVRLLAQVSGKIDKNENLQYWEVSAFSGPSVFMGDIKYYKFVPAKDEWRLAYGLTAGRRLSALFGVRGNLMAGKLAGKQKNGNYRIESNYNEMSLSGILYLDNLFGEKRTDRQVQPYLLAGIGLIFYHTRLFTQQPDHLVKDSGNKTESLLLIGLGIDFRINGQWSVFAESANRGLNTDYLDLYASGYPYDIYNVTVIGLKFRFGMAGSAKGYYPERVTKRKFNRAF